MSLLDWVARMANAEVPSRRRGHSAQTHGEGTWRGHYLAGNRVRGGMAEMFWYRRSSDENAPVETGEPAAVPCVTPDNSPLRRAPRPGGFVGQGHARLSIVGQDHPGRSTTRRPGQQGARD